jgi:hypothetical protein
MFEVVGVNIPAFYLLRFIHILIRGHSFPPEAGNYDSVTSFCLGDTESHRVFGSSTENITSVKLPFSLRETP